MTSLRGTEFAAGSEVACHSNLSQPNFIFRDMIPVAIIGRDGTRRANPRHQPAAQPPARAGSRLGASTAILVTPQAPEHEPSASRRRGGTVARLS
jgi:hypothetical protein